MPSNSTVGKSLDLLEKKRGKAKEDCTTTREEKKGSFAVPRERKKSKPFTHQKGKGCTNSSRFKEEEEKKGEKGPSKIGKGKTLIVRGKGGEVSFPKGTIGSQCPSERRGKKGNVRRGPTADVD